VNSASEIHPIDRLSADDKYRIHYHRVVDLAVASHLLTSDPETEIGHFAFSRYYYRGKELDRELPDSIQQFEEEYPELVIDRRNRQDRILIGSVESYKSSGVRALVEDLILIGASHRVWPVGTSFTLTYPWRLSGLGRSVRFREDLTEFTRRRIVQMLRKAGKLHNADLFGEPHEGTK